MSKSDESKPKFKYVDFDLPFVLFLKDSLGDKDLEKWAEAYAKGEKPLPFSRYAPNSEKPGNLIIGGGFPVYLPPQELAPYYNIRLPEIEVGLRTLRRVNPHRSSILMGEIPGDRTGRASFSSVRVMFALSQIRAELHWRMDLFCHLAIKAVNHFIEHYRVITDRPYVDSVTVSMIQEFHIITEFDDGKQQHQEFGSGSGPLHGFGGAISDELDNALRNAVMTTDTPSIELTLDVNVRNYLDLENWRLVIIESAVMFEAWLSKYLRNKYKENGLTRSEIDAKFVRKNGSPKSITSIAKNLVPEATRYDFSSSSEYQEWEEKVRDLRNEIVHGELFEVNGQQAADAYSTVRAAIALLSSK